MSTLLNEAFKETKLICREGLNYIRINQLLTLTENTVLLRYGQSSPYFKFKLDVISLLNRDNIIFSIYMNFHKKPFNEFNLLRLEYKTESDTGLTIESVLNAGNYPVLDCLLEAPIFLMGGATFDSSQITYDNEQIRF